MHSTVHEKDFHFVVQREHVPFEGERGWTDASGKYYGEPGQIAATTERDRMREIFGAGQVRVVRRDVLVIETPVE